MIKASLGMGLASAASPHANASPRPSRLCRAARIGAAIVAVGIVLGCESSSGDGGAADAGTSVLPDASGVETCQLSALALQCPPASRPLFGQEATARCGLQSDQTGGYESGLDAGICAGEGVCVVACNFENPCTCGIDRITNEGVFCTDCTTAAACGNAICEPGESPEACPVDCAPVCTAETQRCRANDVQTCVSGRWADETCPPGTGCFFFAGAERAWCSPRAAVFEEGLPEIAPAVLTDVDWRELIQPVGRVRCGVPDATCFWRHFARGGDASIIEANHMRFGRGMRRLDHATGVFEELPDTPVPINVVRGIPCGPTGSERQPTSFRDPETGRSVPLASFVDDTVALRCHSVVYRPSNNAVYASMTLDGRFLLLGIWDLPSGSFRRALRFSDPERPLFEGGGLLVSEDGRLVVQAFESSSGGQRATTQILWKPESGSYAGIAEGPFVDLQRGGARLLSSTGTVFDPETGSSWVRPRGQSVLGFTPDGRWAWGISRDAFEREMLTLYAIDDGRIFYRFPMPLQGSGTSAQSTIAAFAPNGRWLLFEGAIYAAEAAGSE
jgi:hypothetical protein